MHIHAEARSPTAWEGTHVRATLHSYDGAEPARELPAVSVCRRKYKLQLLVHAANIVFIMFNVLRCVHAFPH